MKKTISIVLLIALVLTVAVCAFACKEKEDKMPLRFAAPEGTPALAMTRLVTDNKTIAGKTMEYAVVSPSNIGAEMSSAKSSLVIMPVNAGANLIRKGADYKLVSIAVNGSLYIVGKTEKGGELTINDLKGKKIACIGQTGVPGLIFHFVMNKNGIKMLTDENAEPTAENNEIAVQYVADGPAAKTLLASDKADFALVGEPAATAFKGALKLNAELDMQKAYSTANNGEVNGYPQAGLFVKTALAENEEFMTELFDTLKASKEWVTENSDKVSEFAKTNLYESATFPAKSIPRCSINATALTKESKKEIIAFLKNVMPKEQNGTAIDWEETQNKLF